MSSLAQIERVLFLQEVELFSHCEAAQILRIAAIASERSFAGGDPVYRIDDASDAIHCIVLGGIKLETPAHEKAALPAGSAFGVIDILSGRLRTANATASDETLTLAIDAEDFFDLLSNNTDIIKALLQALSERVPTPLAW